MSTVWIYEKGDVLTVFETEPEAKTYCGGMNRAFVCIAPIVAVAWNILD